MTTLTESLLEAGYKYHKAEMYYTLKSTHHSYQKRIINDEGSTKYFINAWLYPEALIASTLLNESVQFEAQLRKGDLFVDISPSTKDRIEAEDIIEAVWQSLEMEILE